MTYEDLLKEADREGLIVKEKALRSADGLIRGNRIAIRNSIPTTIEKACVLAISIHAPMKGATDVLERSL